MDFQWVFYQFEVVWYVLGEPFGFEIYDDKKQRWTSGGKGEIFARESELDSETGSWGQDQNFDRFHEI